MKVRHLVAAAAATLALATVAAAPAKAEDPSRASWNDLRATIFGGKPVALSPLVALDAPYRAEDAAIVPVTIHLALPPGESRTVKTITLVIDENPAPVAAVITVGPQSGIDRIETRVRVNSYTYMQAVAELSDGSLVMAEKYVKAAGGCSAPAGKNRDEANASLGRMKLRQFPAAAGAPSSAPREVQLLIRHPNNSGMQMDQVTRNYIPARFINDLGIRLGDALLLRIQGGISLSEDPTVRFTYRPNGATEFSASIADTSGSEFRDHWPVSPGS